MAIEANSAGQAPLRPKARLLRALSDDLISSDSVALVELVKNAYDADATKVVIRFTAPLSKGHGAIEVLDNGNGMSAKTIASVWTEIATTSRPRGHKSPRFKRTFLGEKGIGRFAAAKLAQEMHLVSRIPEAEEISLDVDWSVFDRTDAYLDEIEISWTSDSPKIFGANGEAEQTFKKFFPSDLNARHGTYIKLSRLSQDWDRLKLERFQTDLSRLITPSRVHRNESDSFEIYVDAPESHGFTSGLIQENPAFKEPHYWLRAEVDKNGLAEMWWSEGSRTVELDPLPLVDAAKPFDCGPFEVEFRVWDRDLEGLRDLKVPAKQFREDLDAAAGVSVYRDGFRVQPYGQLGDDWLQLDRRRLNKPAQLVSNNQVIGEVLISAEANPELRDQTNREGLIENSAYKTLHNSLQMILSQLEARRAAIRKAKRAAKKPASQEKQSRYLFGDFQVEDIVSAARDRLPAGDTLIAMIETRQRELEAGVKKVQETLSRYSRLAVLGRLVDDIIHDGQHPTGRIASLTDLIIQIIDRKSVSTDEKLNKSRKHAESIKGQTELLKTLFRRIQPFGGRRRGRPAVQVLEEVVRDAVAVLATRAREAQVDVDLVLPEHNNVTLDPSEVQQVVVNILDNALFWVTRVPVNRRKIRVSVKRLQDSSIALTVDDSGPGVPADIRSAIFDPYFTNRPDGSGLGLAIAGEIVDDLYDGELSLIESELGGAAFQAIFRKRVQA